jgi:hypothetical protein
MFHTKDVESKHIFCNNFFSLKSSRLWDNVEECGRSGQAADESIIWRMYIACWLANATDTHSEYEILTAYPR